METKNYKLWRFAYTNHIENIELPVELELYCFNKNREKKLAYKGPDNINVWNEHWIGVIKYSDELNNFLKNTHALSYNTWNINNQFVIFDFEQIFPLCEDWPETDELPDISNTYIKYLCLNAHVDTDLLNIESERINSLDISEDKKEEMLEQEFCPVTEYIKIHGFDKGGINFTTIICHSWFDGSPIFKITRTTKSLPDLLYGGNFKKVCKSNAAEYNTALNEMLIKI